MVCTLAVGVSDPLVRAYVQGLGDHNALWFGANPSRRSPLAPETGLRYVPDKVAERIELADAATVYARGSGSCGSLACAVYGYMRAQRKLPLLLTQRVSANMWHVVVRLPNGSIWDARKSMVAHAA